MYTNIYINKKMESIRMKKVIIYFLMIILVASLVTATDLNISNGVNNGTLYNSTLTAIQIDTSGNFGNYLGEVYSNDNTSLNVTTSVTAPVGTTTNVTVQGYMFNWTDGLQFYANFDGGTPKELVNPGLTYTNENTTLVDGHIGKAYDFEDPYGEIRYDQIFVTTSFTISVWVKSNVDNSGVTGGFFSTFNSTTGGRNGMGPSGNENRINLFKSNDNWTHFQVDDWDDGSWHNIIGIFNESSNKSSLYFDGVSIPINISFDPS
ncbi:unnamed protein product, partial [marine sediment metagenome]